MIHSLAMTTAVVLLGLVALALATHLGFRSLERGKSRAAKRELEDLAAMGEVVPVSLHPKIDPDVCIGSGACVRACPEKNILALVDGRAELVNPLGCVGHGACATSCPVEAIKLVFGTEKSGVELPRLDQDFQTNQPGVYIVGELGGMGLIRNAVRQGAQAAAHAIESGRRGSHDAYDAIVVGAGPAGISATLGLVEGGMRVLLIDREAYGGTIMHYPRAKVVMTGALEIPLYGTVRARRMSKEQLMELWGDIRRKVEFPLSTGELVDGIFLDRDGMWIVRSDKYQRRAANVILALGRRGSPRKLEVPGEECPKVHYRLLEPEVFAGQHVLVVGGGNSAVESAVMLSNTGKCASVAISYRRTQFARCRGDNKRQIDDAIRAGRIAALLPTEIVSIEDRSVTLRDANGGGDRSIQNDAVIVQIGGTSPAELLKSFGIELVTKYGEA